MYIFYVLWFISIQKFIWDINYKAYMRLVLLREDICFTFSAYQGMYLHTTCTFVQEAYLFAFYYNIYFYTLSPRYLGLAPGLVRLSLSIPIMWFGGLLSVWSAVTWWMKRPKAILIVVWELVIKKNTFYHLKLYSFQLINIFAFVKKSSIYEENKMCV